MLQPDASALMAQIRALTDRYPGAATLGEVVEQPGALERVVAYTEGGGKLHMAYTLRPLRGGFDWPTMRQLLGEVAAIGEEDGSAGHSATTTSSARSAAGTRARRGEPEPAFARLLMALLLSLRGSVCLYQGEELGLTEAAAGG